MEPKEYEELLKQHDWYYHYSDDHNKFKAGSDNQVKLIALACGCHELDKLYHKYALKAAKL